MTEQKVITIDARGLRCPRPIIEIAKARRQLQPGSRIVIRADDLAFESDVKAWCETTGNTLSSLDQSGNAVLAHIEIN